MPPSFSVKDKVVIVTGCARGIGKEYARALVEDGARVAMCDVNLESLQETADEISEGAAGSVLVREVDVTQQEQVINFTKDVQRSLGRIDGLVNNAGILMRRTPEEMTLEEWESIMRVNVTGTFLLCQAAGRTMIDQKSGSIVNIASIGARQALSLRAAYCTSKAAVEHLTRCLAFEWGRYGIRVNAIAPGYTATAMNADLRADKKVYQQMVSEVPLDRFGSPSDLLGTLVYLLSDASGYVSGQSIYVDGGKTTV